MNILKTATIALITMLSLMIGVSGQSESDKRYIECILLKAGTRARPIHLTRGWFEGDTMYVLYFRSWKSAASKNPTAQGFFKYELKALGRALTAGLSIKSNQEVTYKDARIIVRKSIFGRRFIVCTFFSRSGTFSARTADIKKLVRLINIQ